MNKKEQTGRVYNKIAVALCLLTALLLMIVIAGNILFQSKEDFNFGLEEYKTMDQSWITAGGETFDPARIDEYRSEDQKTILIYCRLPATGKSSQALIFRSKNASVTVSLDDEQVYETQLAEAPFYNHSPGTRWNIIPVRDQKGGTMVRLEIRQAYEDGRAKVDHFYFGDQSAILLNIIGSKLPAIIISLLILFTGIIFAIVCLVLNRRNDGHNYGLLWLAVFAVIATVWSLLETNVFQLFVKNLRLLQVLDDLMLIIGVIPLLMYLENAYHAFRNPFVRAFSGLYFAYVLFAFASQMSGWLDFHQTLNGAVVGYAMMMFLFLFFTVKQTVGLGRKDKDDKIQNIFQHIAIVALVAGLLYDMIQYLTSDVLDRATGTRVGLLAFVLLIGAGSIFHLISLIRLGLETDFISSLAYSDGLTQAGNRTAYTEKLAEIVAHPKERLGIVLFDLNDLKKTNDFLGHPVGDELIRTCAEIIRVTFGSRGSLFRIGGDEFVVLIQDKHPESVYQTQLLAFQRTIDTYNQNPDKTFSVSVAYGFAECTPDSKNAVQETITKADIAMYQKKKEQKEAEAARL